MSTINKKEELRDIYDDIEHKLRSFDVFNKTEEDLKREKKTLVEKQREMNNMIHNKDGLHTRKNFYTHQKRDNTHIFNRIVFFVYILSLVVFFSTAVVKNRVFDRLTIIVMLLGVAFAFKNIELIMFLFSYIDWFLVLIGLKRAH